MRTFIALLTLFVISVAAAAVGQIRPASVGPTNVLALSCRTSPKDSALTVVIYGEKTIALECHITGAPTVNHTTQWIRTGDDCYVPAFYVGLDEDTSKRLPECSKLDAAEPCTLPNPAGFDLVQHNTGFLDRPHYDITTGLTYIGLGHQCGSAKCDKESVEIRGFPISKTQASVLLWHDLHTTTSCLGYMLSDYSANRTTPLMLSDNMWSALVSWTFSIGCDLAAKSQLVSRIVHGESPAAVVPAELPRWNVIHGMPVSDLTTRRNAELTLFRTKSSHIAFPHCDQNWFSNSNDDNKGAVAAETSASPQKPQAVKPCCVCLETKKARDTCYFDKGDEAEKKCHYLVSAHRQCMADFGFKI